MSYRVTTDAGVCLTTSASLDGAIALARGLAPCQRDRTVRVVEVRANRRWDAGTVTSWRGSTTWVPA